MEIRDMVLEEEYGELDLHIAGCLVDDAGDNRWFVVRVVDEKIIEFDDEGLGRAGDIACRGFIERVLFQDDRLGIFKAFEAAKKAIANSMEQHAAFVSE